MLTGISYPFLLYLNEKPGAMIKEVIRLIFTLGVLFFTVSISAQGWYQTYPTSNNDDWQFEIIEHPSGGFIGLGYNDSIQGQNIKYIRRIDSAGNVIWKKRICPYWNMANSMVSMVNRSAGFTVVTSKQEQYTTLPSSMVLKLIYYDWNADTVWTRTLTDSLYNYFPSTLKRAHDGNLLITGTKRRFNGNIDSTFIMKIDSMGNILWNRSVFGDASVNVFYGAYDPRHLIETQQGEYLIFDDTQSAGMKADTSCAFQWVHWLTSWNVCYDVGQMNDGRLFSLGVLQQNPSSNFFASLAFLNTNNGNVDSIHPLTNNVYILLDRIEKDSSGNIYMSGYNWGNYKIIIAKYDSAFNLVWYKEHAIPGYDPQIYDILLHANGKITLSGAAYPISSSGFYLGLVVHLDSLGELSTITGQITPEPQSNSRAIKVCPNPFSENCTIISESEILSFSLYDLKGQLIREEKNIASKTVSLDRQQLQSGIYLYRVMNESGEVSTGKLLVN